MTRDVLAFGVLLAAHSVGCTSLDAGSAFTAPTDASADTAPESVGRACDTTPDCADLVGAQGKYVCGFRVGPPSLANCTSQPKTCIFVSSLGRGFFFPPECGCDGGNVDIEPNWPAASAPVTSYGSCTAAVPRDAATE